MPSNSDNEKDDSLQSSTPANPAIPRPVRQVSVVPLDSPPPAGNRAIHPRPPAPLVPTREERTRAQESEGDSEKE